MIEVRSALEQQGLSYAEANAYLAVLELGQAPVSQIARKLWENRVTVYSTLQNLAKKGYLFATQKNRVLHYFALNPQKLFVQAQQKMNALEAVMGSLLAMSSHADKKPSMQLYEGMEGIKLCYEDTLNYPETTLKAFLGYAEIDPQLKRWLNNRYFEKRVKKKIQVRVLLSNSFKDKEEYTRVVQYPSPRAHTELRFIDNPLFQVSNEISLYGEDKVMMVIFQEKEMIGCIIKSKMLHQTLSSLFDLSWELGKKE